MSSPAHAPESPSAPPRTAAALWTSARRHPQRVVLAILALAFTVYVANAWSPSSYALGMRHFGAADEGLIAGKARQIRMDEWSVITPLTQATVNNGFQRFNRTSLYGEDLRTTYALPLFDWGMALKPTMWLYLVAPPAWAFSFHHGAIILLFLVGHWRLFERLGFSWKVSLLCSVLLLCTGFVQYWWSTLGPPLAFFPWVMLAVRWHGPLWARAPLVAWLTACWLLSFFYPPLFIQQAFIALVFLFAFWREELQWRRLVPVLAASGIAAAATLLYLQDWLRATLTTAYPGGRRVGGGGFGLERTIAHLFPTAYVDNHEHLLAFSNLCELGVIGSFYLLLALVFVDYARLAKVAVAGSRARLVVPLAALLMVAAWMYLPVPSWMGAPLLWNMVPAHRMAFASGFLLVLLAVQASTMAGWRLTWPRVAVFTALVAGGYVVLKLRAHGLSVRQAWRDVVIILPVLAAWLVSRARPLSARALHTGLLGAAALLAVLSFGNFNPLQSAKVIFDRPRTHVTELLDQVTQRHPHGVLVIEGFPGAVLNGWGYPSASHVLTSPQLARFRQFFPEMDAERFDYTFNRYAHLIVRDVPEPHLLQADAVIVPMQAYSRALPAQNPVSVDGPAQLPVGNASP